MKLYVHGVYIPLICMFCTYAADLLKKWCATQSQKSTTPLHVKEMPNKSLYWLQTSDWPLEEFSRLLQFSEDPPHISVRMRCLPNTPPSSKD